MILKLLGMLRGNVFEAVVSLCVGAYLMTLAYNTFVVKHDLNNPAMPVGEPGRMASMSDLRDFEARANKYTDEKAIATKELMISKNEDVLRSLGTLTTTTERLNESIRILSQRVFEMARDQSHGKRAVFSF